MYYNVCYNKKYIHSKDNYCTVMTWSFPLRLREFFKRIRCIFACCNSEIVIENSMIDGKPKQKEKVEEGEKLEVDSEEGEKLEKSIE